MPLVEVVRIYEFEMKLWQKYVEEVVGFFAHFVVCKDQKSDRKMTFEVEELVDTRNRHVEEWFE